MSRDLTREAESLKNLPVYGLHSASYRFLDVIPKENNASCLYSFSSGARPSLFSREHLEQSERVERSWRSVWLSASSVEKIRGMVTMELYFTHERRGFSSCKTWKRHWGSTCYCYFTAVFYCRFCYDLVKQRNGSRRWIANLAIAERKLKKRALTRFEPMIVVAMDFLDPHARFTQMRALLSASQMQNHYQLVFSVSREWCFTEKLSRSLVRENLSG